MATTFDLAPPPVTFDGGKLAVPIDSVTVDPHLSAARVPRARQPAFA